MKFSRRRVFTQPRPTAVMEGISFDHLVGEAEERGRYGQTEGLRGLEVDHQLDALSLLVGCMLAILDEAPSDEERQQSPDNCIDLLKGGPVGLKD